ncbi:MAG: IPTL-CTERM sorting domain-containing protein [Pseudomonadota bacterium]|nr:IPTL-CTERM sorting domain-containing protein [Pseudomonadota bacterium]
MSEAARGRTQLAQATDTGSSASAFAAETDKAKAGTLTAIPTLSLWAQLLLAALLGGLALVPGRWRSRP